MKPEEATREILEKENLRTLSTVSQTEKPEAATIQFVADREFNPYFETFPNYRKYDNLKQNPKAAAVIDEKDGKKNIQMEGKAVELEDREAEKARKKLVDAYGEGTGYLDDQEIKFFKFKPEYPPEYAMVRREGETELH